MKCQWCNREDHGEIVYADCLNAQGRAALAYFDSPPLPVMSWSVSSDPDSWGPWPNIIEFHEGRVVKLEPHDDGVMVTLDTGRKFLIQPK